MIVSTGDKLAALSDQTGGRISRMGPAGEASDLPRIVPVRGSGSTGGNGWMGLRATEASILKGVIQIPLLAGFLGLGVLLLMLSGMWAREGR